ncbi:MAG: hypothetical protein Q8882_04835 [Bacillota bacterium]|nr:hypothetical protein [Bacillota bacterium]
MYTIKKPMHEFIIAFAGPLFNLIAVLCTRSGPLFQMNLAMLIINLVPVLPLDGGRMLKAFLCEYIGGFKCVSVMKTMGKVMGIICLSLGVLAALYKGFNLSIFVIGAFLFASALMDTEGSRQLCCTITDSKDKLNTESRYVKEIAAKENLPARELIPKIPVGHYAIISVTDDKGKICGRITEQQLTSSVVRFGARIKLGEILKNS